MEHNVKSIRKQFAEKGVFYTDTKLANILKGLLTVEYSEVYDPTCGDGALLSVFPDDIKKYGQELDESQLNNAKERLVNFVGFAGDTLVNPAFMDKKFKAIVANPPFSIKWNPMPKDRRFCCVPAVAPPSKADYAFLLHILYMLADDGQAVVLNFPGVLYRGNSEGKIRRWLIEQNYIEKVINVEGDYFVDTKITTAIIVLSKHKTTTDISFEDLKTGDKRMVPVSEVATNDYHLTVSSYLVKKQEAKKTVDSYELEQETRQICLSTLRSSLEWAKLVASLEGWSIKPFVDELQSILNEYA